MRLIGLMSGTSVDSIDAACVEIEGIPPDIKVELASFIAFPWPSDIQTAILECCRPDAPLQRITVLNTVIGEMLADAACAAAEAAGWPLSSVAAIASHGQTVWHQPHPIPILSSHTFGTARTAAGTLQIGEPSVIAARTGCRVVSGFRTADMAVGGQGAPLTSFADFALLSHPTETRAVQNIGGIGNVTYLLAGGSISDVVAFDTGPGNMLLDGIASRTIGAPFDDGGRTSASGYVNTTVLENMLRMPFFSMPPPRTTGREEFGVEAIDRLMREGRNSALSDADLLATAAAVTVESIASSYRSYLQPIAPIDTVIVGGGGVHNTGLMARLRDALAPARLAVHEEFGINSDAKEAIAFALLAYETLHNRPSNVPSATGARQRAILGSVALPPLSEVS